MYTNRKRKCLIISSSSNIRLFILMASLSDDFLGQCHHSRDEWDKNVCSQKKAVQWKWHMTALMGHWSPQIPGRSEAEIRNVTFDLQFPEGPSQHVWQIGQALLSIRVIEEQEEGSCCYPIRLLHSNLYKGVGTLSKAFGFCSFFVAVWCVFLFIK